MSVSWIEEVRVPGEQPLFVRMDRKIGTIEISSRQPCPMSAQQSANLRRVLEQAEQVLATGIGRLDG